MKHILLTFISFFALNLQAQNTSSTAEIDANGNLIGYITKENLQQNFDDWFTPRYTDYNAEEDAVSSLQSLLNNITIKVFMGTWCDDSHEQVPVFFKILNDAKFDTKNVTMVGLDENRQTLDNLQDGFNIARVPTFIFYKNNQEIGRIVEYPNESIEQDMVTILRGKPYKPPYQN